MKIIVFDENNENHHIKPFDIDIPVTWEDGPNLPHLVSDFAAVLQKVPESTLKELIDNSLKRLLEQLQRQPSKQEPVLNRYFNFKDTSQKILLQAYGTLLHISACSVKKGWYDDVVDYIEYNQLSFGIPATGEIQYLEAVLSLLKNVAPESRFTKVEQLIKKKLEGSKQPDVKLQPELMAMFEKWWESIPFDLEYLKPLQDNHDELKVLLFLIGPKAYAKVNRYSGAVQTSVFSIPEMMEVLCRLTDEVTRTLNLLTLHDNQQLTEIGKYELGLTIARRRKKLALGYSQSAKATTPEYQEIWQTWLGDEIAFFGELQNMPQYGQSKDSITFILLPEQLEELKKELGKLVDNPNRLGTLLDGKPVDGPVVILEKCSQNKFCEIFKRLSYNGYVSRNSSEIKMWLQIHFLKANEKLGNQPLGDRTLEDLFQASAKPVAQRIRDFEWLIYKTSTQLAQEASDYKKNS
ncbi:MAG: hypothetical protein K9G41_09800 [Flavobacteriales bacterium]|nr:hypothetical protein [Flavobacteriales bacterium]